MSYIEREKAIQIIEKHMNHTAYKVSTNSIVSDVYKMATTHATEYLRVVPAADVVEIVRCENCKHFHEYPYKGTNDPSGWGKCKRINMDIDLTINDFCSYGERK